MTQHIEWLKNLYSRPPISRVGVLYDYSSAFDKAIVVEMDMPGLTVEGKEVHVTWTLTRSDIASLAQAVGFECRPRCY